MMSLVAFSLTAILSTAESDPTHAQRFEYRTPVGIAYTVTDEGLSEVRLGDRMIARGGWRFRAGDARWGFPAPPDEESISAKSIEIVAPQQARVIHQHAHVIVRYTYTF